MKKKGWLGVTVSVLLVLIVLYLLFQIQAITNPPYRTETAVYYEMSETIDMKAATVFEKQTVEGGGLIGYLVEDGERVSPGQLIAENYTSAEQAQAQAQYYRLQSQIELLQASGNVKGSDVGAITRQLEDGLYSLLADLDAGEYSKATEDFDKYLLAANKVQCLTGKTNGFNDQIAQLQAQMDVLKATIGTPVAMAAPVSGYFVRSERVAPQPYSYEQLEAMSPQELLQTLQQPSADSQQMQAVGQIVTDYRWEIYGATDSALTSQLKKGQSIKMRLPDRGGAEFPVRVEQVETDKQSGISKIKLSCQNITPDALGLGIEQVQLVVNEYEGIRVPRSAEHIRTVTQEDGSQKEEYGVYVQLGRLMFFREITEKLYQNEEYMLLPLEPSNEENPNEVEVYDEVIVEGIDLEDGKLI